jgi:hypothetical protein
MFGQKFFVGTPKVAEGRILRARPGVLPQPFQSGFGQDPFLRSESCCACFHRAELPGKGDHLGMEPIAISTTEAVFGFQHRTEVGRHHSYCFQYFLWEIQQTGFWHLQFRVRPPIAAENAG